MAPSGPHRGRRRGPVVRTHRADSADRRTIICLRRGRLVLFVCRGVDVRRGQAGLYGATIATWVTFVPSFLWIFLGAPFIEHLRGRPSLTAALSTITAAVVGVVLNLAIWFALFTLFDTVTEHRRFGALLYRPDPTSFNPAAALIAIGAAVAVFAYKTPTLKVVGDTIPTDGPITEWEVPLITADPMGSLRAIHDRCERLARELRPTS